MFETPTDRARLRAHLRDLAAQHRTETYHETAAAIGLHPPHLIHSLTRLLEALMDEDAAESRPFLAALVVSRAREGLPARGFFETAARLGRFEGDPAGEEAEAFHAAERTLALAYWAGDLAGARMTDPVELAAALIRCPSVTPDADAAIALLETRLAAAGFRTRRADRNGVPNLYARWGDAAPVLGFNGHLDVVPPGDPAAWRHPPFAAVIADGALYGRGAADMKSGVAAFAAAAIDAARAAPSGSIALLITGDEEGAATDGTTALLDWMAANGERLDHCLVGEPTCPKVIGEAIKIGRRGSMTAHLTATGIQGHSAYPDRAKNPLPALIRLLDRLATHRLDEGTAHFDPSTLALTTIDTGNPASNVIPAEARATLNIRFNDAHSARSLADWITGEADRTAAEHGLGIATRFQVSGESFLTAPGPFTDLVAAAVEAETGRRPALSTSGGTSDARFIKDHCPVVEFGLVGATMHQTDEHVRLADIQALKAIYARIIDSYFSPRRNG